MGKKSILNIVERAKIDVYHSQGYSYRTIAREIGRSHRTVLGFLKGVENNGKSYKARIPTEKGKILRIASNFSLSASKIRSEAGIQASISTVKKVEVSVGYLVGTKFLSLYITYLIRGTIK